MTVIAQSLVVNPARHSGFRLVVFFGLVGLLVSLVLTQQGVDLNAAVMG